MASPVNLKTIVRRVTDPSEEEFATIVDTMNKAFNEAFFLGIQNNNRVLSKDLVEAQIRSALLYGELWVAELIRDLQDSSSEKPTIIGAACWYGRGQVMPIGDHIPSAPWEISMRKLDEGQPLVQVDINGTKKSKNRIWWDKFYEAFDSTVSKALGKGVKDGGYHLQLFGVLPEYQRKGVGSALDHAVTEAVRSSAVAGSSSIMCLETTETQDIISIYEKMGYSVRSKSMVPSEDSGETRRAPFVCMAKQATQPS